MGEISAVDLSGEITERVNDSHLSGKDLVLSYVDEQGRPHQSIRGSTHVHSRDQIAIWVRESYVGTMTPTRSPKESGGFVRAIASNPQVSLLYRDPESKTTFVFAGRAHVETDEKVREVIYAALPPSEQNHSADHSGTAVVIDIDHVVGGTLVAGAPVGAVEMARS
jgi:hypothetical protein